MEAIKKRQLKKKYKTLVWLGYACIAFFTLFLTSVIIIRKHSTADWSTPTIAILLMVVLILPMFLGMVFTMYASFTRNELLSYKRSIFIYRARKFAIKAIEHLQMGELQQAVDEYTKCNQYPEHSLDDYVYGMLISACQLSKDNEKLYKIGIQKINKLKETYDPDKIIL